MKIYNHLLLKKHIRIIIMAIAMIFALMSFFEIVDDVFSDPGEGDSETLIFDKTVLKTFKDLRSPEFNQSMTDITALGSFSVITLLTIITIIFLVSRKDWVDLLYVFIMTLGTIIIPNGLKEHYMRERPDVMSQLIAVKSHSFPSGHSFGATVAYFSLVYLLSRELGKVKLEILYYILAALVVSLVGTSRMYLGVHYPTDVFAGITSGLTWFLIVSIPFVYMSKKRADNENV